MIPLTLEFLESTSEYIIEGKVVATSSIDGIDSKMIYTSYTIEVIQTIKGEKQANTIEIIRPGGALADRKVIVTSVVNLEVGQIGTFFLEEFDYSKIKIGSTKLNTFQGTASLQSLFIYDTEDLSASNPFLTYDKYSVDWYQALGEIVGKNVSDKLKLKPSDLKGAASITNFSPTTIRSGTKEELTINGSGFGTTRGSSVVQFRDPNTGGESWISASAVHYQSWSNSQIKLFVPNSNVSRSGTGQIRVVLGNGMTATSAGDLTVLHAIQTLEFSSGGTNFLVDVQHINDNGDGGITFQYNENNIATNGPALAAFERAISSWRCKSDINWIIGDETSTNAIAQDGINLVKMDNSLPNGILGRATSYYGCGILGNSTWNINELDINFKDIPFTGFTWNYGPGNPAINQFDFESVAVHELGHAHQLGHVIDEAKVMHFRITNADVLRTVDTDSEAGAVTVMTLNTTNPPPCGSIMTAHKHIGFVDKTATGFNNGETWNNAYSNLQDALNQNTCTETIHLAEGTYYTDEGAGISNNDRESSFTIEDEITIEGGYPTGGGIRNVNANQSILSGDISQNDNTSSFAYTVLTINAESTIDGVTIEKGNSSGSTELTGKGGGVYINDTNTFLDCRIRECQSIGMFGQGGGIYQNAGTSTFINTIFDSNNAEINTPSVMPGLGGGLFIFNGSVLLNNCTFNANGIDAIHAKNGAILTIENIVEVEN